MIYEHSRLPLSLFNKFQGKRQREISSNTTCINAMQTFGFYAVILFPLSLFLLLPLSSSITFVLSNGIICISTEEVNEEVKNRREGILATISIASHIRKYSSTIEIPKKRAIMTRSSLPWKTLLVCIKSSFQYSKNVINLLWWGLKTNRSKKISWTSVFCQHVN